MKTAAFRADPLQGLTPQVPVGAQQGWQLRPKGTWGRWSRKEGLALLIDVQKSFQVVFARFPPKKQMAHLVPDDKNLPSVPPLQLSVPADYPDQSPLWIDNPQQYGRALGAGPSVLSCSEPSFPKPLGGNPGITLLSQRPFRICMMGGRELMGAGSRLGKEIASRD